MRVGQDFDVEREPLDEDARQHALQHLAAKDLEPGLRVLDGEAEHQPDDRVVDRAVDAPDERIVDLGFRVALAADHDVGAGAVHDVEELRQLRGMEVHVGVQEDDVVAAGEPGAAHQRVALAQVFVVADHAHAGRIGRDELERLVVREVLASVVDDDDLVVVVLSEGDDDLAQIVEDVRRLVVGRHDDADRPA